jgi:trimeric autotransporter adhesin
MFRPTFRMPHRMLFRALYCLLWLSLTGAPAHAAEVVPDGTLIPTMAANINQMPRGSGAYPAIVWNDTLYFFTGYFGGQSSFWRYVPATDQIEQVPLIYQDTPIEPHQVRGLGDSLYVVGITPGNHQSLWRYMLETGQLTLIFTQQSGPMMLSWLTPLDDDLYFSGDDGTGQELWRYRTTSGDLHKIDVRKGWEPAYVQYLAGLEGELYFSAHGDPSTGTAPDDIGPDLWRYTPGTDKLTRIEVNPSGWSQPRALTVMGRDLYFFAQGKEGDETLWRYTPHRKKLAQIPQVTGHTMTVAGGDLFTFWHQDGNHVLRYRPADNSVTPVGPDVRYDLCMQAVDGALYYAAAPNPEEWWFERLWRYDLATDMTTPIDIAPGQRVHNIQCITALGDSLYFSVAVNNGVELWRYDRNSGHARMLRVNPADQDSAPTELTVLGDALYFQARNDKGIDLWRHRPATGQTQRIEIDPNGGSIANSLVVLDDKLYFAAFKAWRWGLWSYDPATGKTRLHEAYPAEDDRSIHGVKVMQGELYVVVGSRLDSNIRMRIWRYNPATGQSSAIAIPLELEPWSIIQLAEAGGKLYFIGWTPLQETLWRYDPATREVKQFDFDDSQLTSWPQSLTVIGDILYLRAYMDEKWLLMELRPQADVEPAGILQDVDIVNLAVVGESLYIWAGRGEGRQLFQVTPSVTGATEVTAVTLPGGLLPNTGAMVAVGNNLLITRWEGGANGYQQQLWLYHPADGAVSQIEVPPNVEFSFHWNHYYAHGETLYIQGRAFNTSDAELWRYEESTNSMEKIEIRPGPGGSYPQEMTLVGDTLFFSAVGDDLHGRELWMLPLGDTGMEPQIYLPQVR